MGVGRISSSLEEPLSLITKGSVLEQAEEENQTGMGYLRFTWKTTTKMR